MATKIVTYSSKSIGDTWFATEANQLKDVINSNVSAFLDHTGSASVHRAIDDSASGATDLWSAQKIQTELTGKAAAAHIHDDRYYTESEVDALISGFSSGGSEFADNVFRVYDSDATGREIAFNASAITSPNTRNIIMADQDIDLEPGNTFAAASANFPFQFNGSAFNEVDLTGGFTGYEYDSGVYSIFTVPQIDTTTFSDSNTSGRTDIRTLAGKFFVPASPTANRTHDLLDFPGVTDFHIFEFYIVGTGGTFKHTLDWFGGFKRFDERGASTYSTVTLQPGVTYRFVFTNSGSVFWYHEIPSKEPIDDFFRIRASGDTTKKIAFDADNITTTTTRTITMPDQDVDLTPGSGTFAAAADKSIGGEVVADGTALTVTNGLAYFPVPTAWNGLTVSRVFIYTPTAGTGTGTTTIRFYNVTQATDLFTTSPSIDPTENGSDTAATAYVIDSGVTLATDDIIRVDCTAITGTTAAEGLTFTLEVA